MSTVRARKKMHCCDADCEKCNKGIERPGHVIDLIHSLTSDIMTIMLDGKVLLCLSDDVWDAIVDLDKERGWDGPLDDEEGE